MQERDTKEDLQLIFEKMRIWDAGSMEDGGSQP